jgi:hypothetical protein
MIRGGLNMAGKSLLAASEEQRVALRSLAESRDRGEADRARAVLLTLAGWTSPRIAEAFGVREDTVRLWRSDFVCGGVAAMTSNATVMAILIIVVGRTLWLACARSSQQASGASQPRLRDAPKLLTDEMRYRPDLLVAQARQAPLAWSDGAAR